MDKKTKSVAAIWGAIIAIINFVLFIVSTKFILQTPLMSKNIIAVAVLSVIVGFFSFVLYLLKPKVAFSLFVIGLIAGYGFMINTYSKNMDGWGDLAGLLTFFMLALAGLISGLIIQLVVYLVIKNKNRKATNGRL